MNCDSKLQMIKHYVNLLTRLHVHLFFLKVVLLTKSKCAKLDTLNLINFNSILSYILEKCMLNHLINYSVNDQSNLSYKFPCCNMQSMELY